MTKPHVHCDCIKAWADGAEIEMECASGKWMLETDPTWRADYNYRIKPQPREPRRWWITLQKDGVIDSVYLDKKSAEGACACVKSLGYVEVQEVIK